MRRRRPRGAPIESVLNLDSLVDVITNTNGMLILLAVFTTIIVTGKVYRVGFPVARTPQKEPVFFECQSNRVVPITDGQAISSHYETTRHRSGFAVMLKDAHDGDPPETLRMDTEFSRALGRIDHAKQYAAFIVRADSFEVFRVARDVARSQDIEVGWEPWKSAGPLSFGTGGRSVDVQ